MKKTLLSLLLGVCMTASLTSISAATEGSKIQSDSISILNYSTDDYSETDVNIINTIISDNGLHVDKNDPKGWEAAGWIEWDNSSPKRIIYLNLDNRGLTDTLNISGLTALTALRVSNNHLTGTLDVSGLTELTTLHCYTNQLTGLTGLEELINLEILHCGNNKITTLGNLEKLINLKSLYCWENSISQLTGIDKLTELEVLSCFTNDLTGVMDVSLLTKLNVFSCADNHLTGLKGLDKLNDQIILNIVNNPYTTFTAVNGKTLTIPPQTGGTVWLQEYTTSTNEIILHSVPNNGYVCTALTGISYTSFDTVTISLDKDMTVSAIFEAAKSDTLEIKYDNSDINSFNLNEYNSLNMSIDKDLKPYGVGNYTWNVDGVLPDGISFTVDSSDSTKARISGTPTTLTKNVNEVKIDVQTTVNGITYMGSKTIKLQVVDPYREIATLLKNADCSVSMQIANTKENVADWLKNTWLPGVSGLSEKITVNNLTIIPTSFTAAVAGTANDSDGTNGFMTFSIAIKNKGTTAVYGNYSCVIVAAPYKSKGDGISYYTLTFKTNSGNRIERVTAVNGTMVDLADYKPTRKGYKFDGWFSDATLANKITGIHLTSDKTVYAGWTRNTVKPVPSEDLLEKAPQTGDASSFFHYIWMVITAFVVMIISLAIRKRNHIYRSK